jgi:nucleoside-diphosphate-sugar epimerase
MESLSHLVVAGANGWVGGAVLAAARRRGVEATPLSVRSVGHPGSAGLGDLAGLLSDPQTALVNAVGRTSGSRALLEDANVETCRLLADACERSGNRFVTVGSAAEVGIPCGELVREQTPEHPVGDYGRSKLAATMLVRERRERGLRGTVARVFNIVGPGRPGTSPVSDFAAAVRRLDVTDGVVEVRDSSLVRDLSSLGWVAERLVDLAAVAGAVETVNVCSGRGTSYRELIEAMAEALGLTVSVTDTRPGGIARVVGDPTLLRSLVECGPTEEITFLARLALED